MSQVHLEIPAELAERLHEAAAQRGLTEDEIASEVLSAHLPPVMTEPESLPRRLGFVSLGASGRSDISERHEEILRAEFPG